MKKLQFKHYSPSDKRNFLFVYLLIAIPVLQFVIFWFYVNISSIGLAFQNRLGEFTLVNFKNVFLNIINKNDPNKSIITMVGKSLILWLTTNVVAYPFGLAGTYVLYKRVTGHYAFRVIFSIAGIVGAVVWVSLIKGVCDPDGFVQYILTHVFHANISEKALTDGLFLANDTAFKTIVFITFISGAVGGSVIVTGAYTKVPPELLEAAKLDGLDFWGSFVVVSLPCSWPTLQTLITVSLCSMLVVEGNVYLYTNGTGGNGTATMGYYLYTLTLEISKNPITADYYYAAALGVVISLVSIPVVLLGRRILNKVIPTVEV